MNQPQQHNLNDLAHDIHQSYQEYIIACAGEDDQSYETAQMFLTEFLGMYFNQAYLERTGEKYNPPDEDETIRDRFLDYIRHETDFRRFDDLTAPQIKEKLDEHIQLVFDEQKETKIETKKTNSRK